MKQFLSIPLAGLLACMGLTACVSVPTTTPTESRLTSDHVGLAAAKAPAINDTWWTAFGDEQLDSLIDQSLHGSPTLASAIARMREAQAELSANRAANYPQISVDAQETRQRFSENYIIPPPFGGTTKWIGTAQAKLNWSLDFWANKLR